MISLAVSYVIIKIMAENKLPSILIIDDDPDFSAIMTAKLESAGFVVHSSSNGEEGIEKAAELVPDLILLDLEMPSMSGVQVLKKIKEEEGLQNIKAAFLTSHGESGEENEWLDKKFAAEIGAAGYIRKTDDLEKIVSEIKTILGI